MFILVDPFKSSIKFEGRSLPEINSGRLWLFLTNIRLSLKVLPETNAPVYLASSLLMKTPNNLECLYLEILSSLALKFESKNLFGPKMLVTEMHQAS